MKLIQFTQQGKRSNNEDSLGTSAALLTVCDGMGGHNYGERASAFVKEAMLKAFAEPRPLSKMEIQQQLNQVQTDLNQLLEKEPELEKMGTTFTGVFITPDVWYAAHIGDSRIYLFRPSEQKLWHTWDHSLVGELMRTKEIPIEAGRFHPMSNRISKAVIAQKDGKPVSASIVKIDELKKGDILLLCSDGVVEGWGDWELVQLFSDESLSFEKKCKKLAKQCNEKSKDNNTAIIVEIEEKDAFSFGTNDELEWTPFAEVEADYQQYVKDNEEVKEEAPKPQAPANPQPKEEQTGQEAKKPEARSPLNPQSAATHRPTPKPIKPSDRTERIPLAKLLPFLLALLLIVVIGTVMLLRGRTHEVSNANQTPSSEQVEKGSEDKQNEQPLQTNVDKEEEDAYKKCTTIAACNSYLKAYPTGRYVNEVKDKKAELEAAEAKAQAQAEAEKMEKDAYKKCTTIAACDSYLKAYPKGQYVNEVKAKKAELEAAKTEAEAKAEAEKKEKEAYKKCTTIAACNSYLEAYPTGQHVAEVKAKKAELEAQAKAEAEAKAQAEAKNMEEEDDAYHKCTTIDGCENYLKKYPNGRYVEQVKKKKTEFEGESNKPSAKETVENKKGNNLDSIDEAQRRVINSAPIQKIRK